MQVKFRKSPRKKTKIDKDGKQQRQNRSER